MAHVAVGKLESEGIESWLQDETTVGMFWSLGNALGGIKLQVRGQDAMRAQDVLAEPSAPHSPLASASEEAAAAPSHETAQPAGRPRKRPLGAGRLTAHRDKLASHARKTRVQRQCAHCGSGDLRPLPGNSRFERIRAFLRGRPLPLQCRNCGASPPPAGLSRAFPTPGPSD
jgi:hypothetical protein